MNASAIRNAVAGVSTHFLGQAAEHDIMAALSELGQLFEADRSYVFRFSPVEQTMTNMHEWCAEGISPEIDLLQDIPTEDFPWWMMQLESGRALSIPDVAALPPEAGPEREILLKQAIQSLVVVPLFIGKAMGGFIGLDYVRRKRGDAERVTDKLLSVLTTADPGSSKRCIIRRTNRVLIVDDDPLVQSFMKVLFELHNFEVDVCSDGVEAVEYSRTRAEGVDLVVMDLMMPRMNGDEAFYEMLPYWPDARVLLVSGEPGDVSIDRLVADGAVGFVAKPFNLSVLAEFLPEGTRHVRTQ